MKFLRTLVNIALHFLLSVLSVFVPKKKGLYIFGSGNGKGLQGNPKYLFLHFLSNKEVGKKVFWSTACRRTKIFLNNLGLPVMNKYGFKAFFLILRAEFIFIEKGPDDVYYLPNIIGRFNFIQTWHGVALKYIGADAIIEDRRGVRYFLLSNSFFKKTAIKLKLFTQHRYRLICSTSDFTKKILENSFQNNNVVTTGYPRNDLFFRPDLSIEKIKENLGLNSYDKIWLYAPTYRDNYANVKPFSSKDWKALNEMLKSKNYALLIKKHPLELNLEVSNSVQNIFDVSALVFDIQEILLHCDGLISDYSSISSDFSIIQKPIIFFVYDIEEYAKKCRGFYAEPLKVFPGPFAYNAYDVLKLIADSDKWFNDPEYKIKYENYRKLYNEFVDGNSTTRLLSAIK